MDERYDGGDAGASRDPYGYPEVPSQRVDPFADASSNSDPYTQSPSPYAPTSGSTAADPFGSETADGYAAPASASASYPTTTSSASTSTPYTSSDPYRAGDGQRSWAPAQPYPGVARPTSGMAVASLVLGILSITMCSGLTSLPGLVCAIVGMRETGATGAKGGRGLAIAGLVTSIIGLLILAGLAVYIAGMIGLFAYSATASS